MKVKLQDILVPERQRKDYGDIEELASSLQENGLIQPILVAPRSEGGWELVAGGRRLAAAKLSGWEEIEVYNRDDLTPIQKKILEFEENIRRKDTTWQERCLAVAELHLLKSIEVGFAVHKASGDSAWTIKKMADFTGFKKSSVTYMLQIAEELKKEPKSDMWACTCYTDAIKWMFQRKERELYEEIEKRRQENLRHAAPKGSSEEGDVTPSSQEDVDQELTEATPKIYIAGYPCKLNKIPDVANLSHGILAYNVGPEILPFIAADLRPEGIAIVWSDDENFLSFPPNEIVPSWSYEVFGLFAMPWPLIWNKVLAGESAWPFSFNYARGLVLTKRPPTSGREHTSVISAHQDTDGYLPAAVVDFSVRALCLENMAVRIVGGVNPVHVLETGRTPFWNDPEAESYNTKLEAVKEHYRENLGPSVEFHFRT